MKNQADTQTAERFPAPRRRGRPSTGQAKSAAERMRAYRARKRAGEVRPQVKTVMTASVTKNAADPNSQEQTVAQLREQLARVEHERDEALAKARKEKRDVMNKASPMTDPVENLILEHLKALREELRDFKTQTVAGLIWSTLAWLRRAPCGAAGRGLVLCWHLSWASVAGEKLVTLHFRRSTRF